MSFNLSDWQLAQIAKWKEEKDHQYCGAIGGRYTYSFTPTSLGVVITVEDNVLNNKIDVSDYGDW